MVGSPANGESLDVGPSLADVDGVGAARDARAVASRAVATRAATAAANTIVGAQVLSYAAVMTTLPGGNFTNTCTF